MYVGAYIYAYMHLYLIIYAHNCDAYSVCAHQCQSSHTQLYVVIVIHRNQVNNVDEFLWTTSLYHTSLIENVEATAIHTYVTLLHMQV